MEKSAEKRLQSLKLPRDLTLGGTKPKKMFMPNLNVARNKDKGKDLFIKTEDKRKTNNRKDIRNNKKPGIKLERFVQSSGIFSDGVGNDALKKVRFERAYAPRDDVKNVIPVPKIKKDDWQVDAKSEAKVYEEIVADNGLMEDDDISSFAPISWNDNDFKERKVFAVNKTLHDESLDIDKVKVELDKHPKSFQDADQFSDYNPSLTLWKLPDSFAGKGLSDDPNVQHFTDYKLNEMLEGQIGSVRIHKSGKMDVLIGSVRYQIEASQLETFTEKIVAIDSKRPRGAGIVLGEVQNRFILNPDWGLLLKES